LHPPSDTAVYVRVPAGLFQMGSEDGAEDEKPQHEASLPEFGILRTKVTNGQYQECVAAKAAGDLKSCDAPEGLRANSSKLANWPVVNVSWQQAQQYAAWKGGRLPSEAEWEKACRGEKAAIYPWGDEPPTPERTNYGYNKGAWTVVGSYPDGASPYGLYDMAGNVWEWTNSLYRDYPYNFPNDAFVQTLERRRSTAPINRGVVINRICRR
jgi:formylglycine-generating enzyme required for sulfatase activity